MTNIAVVKLSGFPTPLAPCGVALRGVISLFLRAGSQGNNWRLPKVFL
jgi:hypothetical protein